MIWFITGLAIGAIAVFLWCERNWYRYKADSEAFHAAVAAVHKRYVQERDSIRRWGDRGFISALPSEPPPLAAFRFQWRILPESAVRDFCGILRCDRAATELDRLLAKAKSKVPLERRIEYQRADMLRGVAEYLVAIEQRYLDGRPELPSPSKPIDIAAFDDIHEADEREEREADFSEVMRRMDEDEKTLEKYRSKLLAGELFAFTALERARELEQVEESLAEIRSARSEGRLPDLVDYEWFDDLDELEDDDLDDDLDEDDDDDDLDEVENERREGGEGERSN